MMAMMDASTTVTRRVDTDLEPEELWTLIADGDRWTDWMVDGADVDVREDADGRVTDTGTDRDVRIREVSDGDHVAFEWWPSGSPDHASRVDLRVLPTPGGASLLVVETLPAVLTLEASASERWWTARASRLVGCRRPPLLLAA